MCFPNSLPNHDFTRSPISSEFLVWIHFLLGYFSRVEVENWAHEPDNSESECWKVILHLNITFISSSSTFICCIHIDTKEKVVMWPWSDHSQQRMSSRHIIIFCIEILKMFHVTGKLGYDGPLYDGVLHMADDMLGPSPMHIKYSSYVYDGFCIWRTNFPGPIESVISKFTCICIFSGISSMNYTTIYVFMYFFSTKYG